MEACIIENINNHLIDGFERDFFKEAINNLEYNSRLRISNFSYAIRELIREVLVRMSPDEKVLGSKWFEPYFDDEPERLTRAQRLRFAIHGGINPDFVENELGIDAKNIIKELKDKVDELSKYTHVTEKIFYEEDNKESKEVIESELRVFSDFLTTIENCKRNVVDNLHDQLCEHVINEFLISSIDEVDELSTHHCVDEVHTDCFKITTINDSFVEIEIEGTICVEQSWGSSSDFRRGDGASINSDFPFVSTIFLEAYQPNEFKVVDYEYRVDTSSWSE